MCTYLLQSITVGGNGAIVHFEAVEAYFNFKSIIIAFKIFSNLEHRLGFHYFEIQNPFNFFHFFKNKSQMFEAKILQGALLKKIIEAIRDLVTDANLDCTERGIFMQVF